MKKSVERLTYLRTMLSKYRYAYYLAIDRNKELSSRMYGWIDEYNDAKGSDAWYAYCAQHGSDTSHNATDLFA